MILQKLRSGSSIFSHYDTEVWSKHRFLEAGVYVRWFLGLCFIFIINTYQCTLYVMLVQDLFLMHTGTNMNTCFDIIKRVDCSNADFGSIYPN